MLLANIADSCAQSSSYSYFTNGIVPSETQISSQRHPASYHHVDLVQEPSERRRVKSKYTKRKNYKPYESVSFCILFQAIRMVSYNVCNFCWL